MMTIKRMVTVTANPSIDKMFSLQQLNIGEINRPQRSLTLAGGKGLNVSRVLVRLDAPVCACILLGGHGGRWIEEQLKEEKIEARVTWGEGESRTCISMVDLASGVTTSIYEQGFLVAPDTWKDFETFIATSVERANAVTLSGSLPHSVPADGYARLIRLAAARSVPVLLDTSGEALKHALPEKPTVLKINDEEAGEVTGTKISTIAEAVQAARHFHEQGIAVVVLTMGNRGSVAVSAAGAWQAFAPAAKTQSAVGSGDSFLAGFALALLQGSDLLQALRLGTAAGAANAASFGAGNVDPTLVHLLVNKVKVQAI